MNRAHAFTADSSGVRQAHRLWHTSGTNNSHLRQGTQSLRPAGLEPDTMFSAKTLLLKTFESMADTVIVAERSSRKILAVNPAFETTFGYTQDEVVGRVTDFLYPSHEEFLRAGSESAETFARADSFRGSYTMRCKDGRLIQSLHTLSPIFDGDRRLAAAVSVIRDHTEWLQIEQRLAEQDQLLTNIVATLPGAIFARLLSEDGSISMPFFRGALARQIGSDTERTDHPPDILREHVHPDDLARLEQATRDSARTMKRLDIDLRLKDAGGQYLWVRSLSQPRQTPEGGVIWDGVAVDVTREKVAEQRVLQLANYDQLTGLPNRRLFRTRVNKRLEAVDGAPSKLVVAAINLDRFKLINTTHGIEVGDKVLATVAQRLQAAAGREGVVGRIGADEFIVLYGPSRHVDDALPELQLLSEAVSAPFTVEGTELQPTASVGVAVYPHDGADADTLLRNADAALHRARSMGGGRIEFYSEAITESMAHRLQLERELRAAIDTGQLVPHYQPQIDPRTGRIVGMEALVRWEHPTRGLIMPGQFIDIAEETGLIRKLGMEVLRQVCTQLRRWRDAGIGTVPVAVNLSAKQLDGNLLDHVTAALAEQSLEPGAVELEITESSLLQDTDHAIHLLGQLHEQGMRFALDDFGTGYSALSYLQRFPFQKIKIDRSFIQRIPTDSDQTNLVRAMIAMAASLHMTTVAEGVETPEQLGVLTAMGCNAVQGWIYGKAEPADVIAELLASGAVASVSGPR